MKQATKVSKRVRITCEGSGVLALEKLLDLQGELKSLSPENADRLRRSIVKHGFSAPLFLWKSPEGESFLLDGTQRRRVLEDMKAEGWKVPPLPVVYVEARNKEEAMQKLLQFTSTYGTMDKEGLGTFINLSGLDVATLLQDFAIPEANLILLDQFKRTTFDTITEDMDPGTIGISKKDKNWLLVDYYRDDKRFNQIRSWLKNLMKGDHELDRDKFYAFVKKAMRK